MKIIRLGVVLFFVFGINSCKTSNNATRSFLGPHVFFYPSFQSDIENTGLINNGLPTEKWDYKVSEDTFSVVWNEFKSKDFKFVIPNTFFLHKEDGSYFEFRDSIKKEIIMIEVIPEDISNGLRKDSLMVNEIKDFYLSAKSASTLDFSFIDWTIIKFKNKDALSTAMIEARKNDELRMNVLCGAYTKNGLFAIFNYQSSKKSPVEVKVIFSEIVSRCRYRDNFIIPSFSDFESVHSVLE